MKKKQNSGTNKQGQAEYEDFSKLRVMGSDG